MTERGSGLGIVAEPWLIPNDHPHWFADWRGSAAIYWRPLPRSPPCTCVEAGEGYVVAKWGSILIVAVYTPLSWDLAKIEGVLDVIDLCVRQHPQSQISQPTISRIVFRVSILLASYINRYIKIPSSEESRSENKRLFRELGRGHGGIGLPSIDGAIDCTHIRLVHTRFQNVDEIFRNRKGYFSLSVQIIVGPRTEILDIVPEWPGSEHDSRIFQNSRIYMRYKQGELDGILVGDAGYPALPFLLTPIGNPRTDEEMSYNTIHGRTRRIVERTFGIWKLRFPCLSKGLGTKLLTSTSIVVACAVLHNLSLILNDKLEEDDEEVENLNNEVPVAEPHWQPGDGFLARDALIERLFR
ncbi:putative nuclease HARBI1 [Temnothorax longispinosus]|uniref:putative nuclease HARBI1 n=1 Tax=Temnothorax longispinosus TaxID=300112 RepID=UPI003A9A1F0E